MKYLVPEYVYTDEGFQDNKMLEISEDGYVVAITDVERDTSGHVLDKSALYDVSLLPGIALLPGFVNAHSHVFQRALRGHTHHGARKGQGPDSFWTWREAMYAEAQRLNPENLYTLARRTYSEMVAAGYTSVGEFHYVHHQPNGQPYADPNAMSKAILAAARDAGIRVMLLMTAYAQAGFNLPAEEGQRRFCDASVEAFLARVDALRLQGIPVGVAPHSVRAVPEAWFRAIADYSRVYDVPLHVHADEQVAEVEQCQAVYGCTPIELLERFGALGRRTTVVHATHANATEIALLAQHGCTVCVCPTTEGDLGDGIAPYAELLAAQMPLAIGADSNTRFDPFEELRWAEYTARMRYQRRRVLVADEGDDVASPGPLLLAYGTRHGAAALGLAKQVGRIAAGMAADLIAVDLNAPVLAGWDANTDGNNLLDVLFFGASSEVVVATWVQGRRVWGWEKG